MFFFKIFFCKIYEIFEKSKNHQKMQKTRGGPAAIISTPILWPPLPKNTKKCIFFGSKNTKFGKPPKVLTKMHLKQIMNGGYPAQMGSERPSTGRFSSDFAPPVGSKGYMGGSSLDDFLCIFRKIHLRHDFRPPGTPKKSHFLYFL
jgi:hypothetical protein